MKYFLLIAALAAAFGLTRATSSTPKAATDCCDGGGCCRTHQACCDTAD